MKSGTVFPELGIKIGSGTQTRSSWFVIICLAEPVVVRLGEFAYPGEALLAPALERDTGLLERWNTLVDLDSAAPAEVIQRIAHIPGVLSIRAVPDVASAK